MKIIRLLLYCLSFSTAVTCGYSQNLASEKLVWYDYYWDGDSSNPKDAMMLRSTIDTINFNFRWQFDTGSPRTFFYGNIWKSFERAFQQLSRLFFVTDSTKQDGYINLNNPAIRISNKKIPGNRVGFLPGYGDDIDKEIILNNPGASVTVGTIGIDLFRKGVLAIDFKTNRIGYSGKLSDKFYTGNKNTTDFILYQNRIVLPVTIGSELYYFFYDSGASLFPLKTTAALAAKMPAIIYSDTLRNITTWGKSYDVPGGTFHSKLQIGKMVVTPSKIYVHPDPEKYHTRIFEEAEVSGLLGNAYFDSKIIIIDFTRMKFTIIDDE